tara:strand:- start:9099 stop:10007 length:909 start_codon:yes stop_codon:yes gene_type:complete
MMSQKYYSRNIAIIVTSIGEKYLNECINSVLKQSIKIGQVILSLPKETVYQNRSKRVIILRSKYKNQVYQRSLAKKYIKKNIKIIIQLDCKILLSKNFLKNLINLWNNQSNKVIGIGFVPSNYNLPKVKFFQKIFLTNSSKIGKVLKSGYVSAWNKNVKNAKVEWLHGGCVSWKFDKCKDIFDRKYPLINWCVAEDLIYSFNKNKKYDLILSNKAKVKYINKSFNKTNSSNNFNKGFLHAKVIKNFVLNDKRLSLIFFYYSMLASSIIGIFISIIKFNNLSLAKYIGRLLGSFSKTFNYKIK